MSKPKTGLKRTTIDKYYTSPSMVDECMNLITSTLDITDNDICIEPSAGNGAFIDRIKETFTNYKFYDLEPENDEIIKQDFLEYNFQQSDEYKQIHVIGNPPFGRQSSLAIKFIKNSAKFANSISFILPKSFKKDSMKKHFNRYFHLELEYDLPHNSFLVDDKPHDVPCVFQIWIKKNIKRDVPPKLYPNKYSFVKKTDEHDISFRRVGIYAGEVSKTTDSKSIQSHYFIKFEEPLTDELFTSISNLEYNNKNNTVGPKSISKQELIKEFNELFN